MKLHVALVPLFLLGSAIAQESVPVVLSGEGHVPICRGKGDDDLDCVTAPRANYSPDPKYPEKARKAHQRGDVILQLVVGTDGLPHDVKVDRGLTPEMEESAIDAVKHWKFTPATRDRHPVPAQIKVAVSFKLY